MGGNRVGSVIPRERRNLFVDGRDGFDLALLRLLFDEFMGGLPELPEPEDVDPLRLQKASEGVLFSLYSEVAVFASQYDVPGDLLWDVVVDWVIADDLGRDRTPVELFMPEKGGPELTVVQNGMDDMPCCSPGHLAEARAVRLSKDCHTGGDASSFHPEGSESGVP